MVGEDLQILESLVLFVDFIENSLSMFLALGSFLLTELQVTLVVYFLYSLVENKIGVATPLEHPALVVILIIVKFKVVIIPPLLSSKALFLQVSTSFDSSL